MIFGACAGISVAVRSAMSSVWLDLRHALRAMTRAPAATMVLAITLAIGIAASTTMFSIIDSVVLAPLPYHEADRIARLYSTGQHKRTAISRDEHDDIRQSCQSCAALALWNDDSAAIAGGDRPVRVRSARATHTLLPLRTGGAPETLIPAVQRAVLDLDPDLPLSNVRTMDEVLGEAIARPRFVMALLVGFAVVALVLAAVGIYGVMAHTVAQRTHEIGLRIALGAVPGQVRAMVLSQAMRLVASGVAGGLGAAIALQLMLDAPLVRLFHGERLSDPLLLAGTAIAIAAIALVATWLPARHASHIEPLTALRSE
jgi:hypothetical protein